MVADNDTYRNLVDQDPTDSEWLELMEREMATVVPAVAPLEEAPAPGSPPEPVSPPVPGQRPSVFDSLPADIPAGTVTHYAEGGTDNDVETRISHLDFNGYKEVWNRVTGVLSLQPNWLLWQAMAAKFPDGTRVYQMTDPGIKPNYGDDLRCFLHPDEPGSERLKSMGYGTCKKKHLANRASRNAHTSRSHKPAWAFMLEDKVEREREEDRERHRQLLDVMMAAAARGVAVEAQSAPVAVAEVMAEAVTAATAFSATCKQCLRVFAADNIKWARAKVKLHQRWCKA